MRFTWCWVRLVSPSTASAAGISLFAHMGQTGTQRASTSRVLRRGYACSLADRLLSTTQVDSPVDLQHLLDILRAVLATPLPPCTSTLPPQLPNSSLAVLQRTPKSMRISPPPRTTLILRASQQPPHPRWHRLRTRLTCRVSSACWLPRCD